MMIALPILSLFYNTVMLMIPFVHLRIRIMQIASTPKSTTTILTRDAGKKLWQGGPTGAKGHLLP